jgi:Ion channel
MDGVAISLPLLVGIVANAATIVIHALAVRATVAFVRHEDQAGRVGVGFWTGVAVLAVGVFFALVAHLLEIGVWAVLFMLCGEFPAFATAYDHSVVNYTTLGYGNVIMTPSWRFLGPLEAANGMLLFGVSAALVFSVIQYLIRAGRSAGNVWRP